MVELCEKSIQQLVASAGAKVLIHTYSDTKALAGEEMNIISL